MQLISHKEKILELTELDAVLGGIVNERGGVVDYDDEGIFRSNNEMSQFRQFYVEKILCDKEGRPVRATFCVYENAGRIKARLVNVVYLEEKDSADNVVALPGYTKDDAYFVEVFEKSYISPYSTLENIYFSGSKPRAPTL